MYELSYFLGVLMPKKKTVKQKKQTVQKKIKPVITSKTMKTKTKRKPAQSKTVAPVKKAPAKKINLREKKFQEIRKKLLAQKKSLLIGAIEAMNNELVGPTVFPDLGDQATAEMDRNFMLRLRGRERKLLKKIDEAIERIEQHIFGLCDKCGDEIAMRRLEARPVTTMCIECKILQEEEEKLREP
jgi:DnaK suppressor protein